LVNSWQKDVVKKLVSGILYMAMLLTACSTTGMSEPVEGVATGVVGDTQLMAIEGTPTLEFIRTPEMSTPRNQVF
jgi:hypothetical protein